MAKKSLDIICIDDETYITNMFKTVVEIVGEELGVSLDTDTYHSTGDTLDDIEERGVSAKVWLIDIMMRGGQIDGSELAEKIRHKFRNQETIIYAYTALNANLIVERYANGLFDGVYNKALSPMEATLTEIIKTHFLNENNPDDDTTVVDVSDNYVEDYNDPLSIVRGTHTAANSVAGIIEEVGEDTPQDNFFAELQGIVKDPTTTAQKQETDPVTVVSAFSSAEPTPQPIAPVVKTVSKVVDPVQKTQTPSDPAHIRVAQPLIPIEPTKNESSHVQEPKIKQQSPSPVEKPKLQPFVAAEPVSGLEEKPVKSGTKFNLNTNDAEDENNIPIPTTFEVEFSPDESLEVDETLLVLPAKNPVQETKLNSSKPEVAVAQKRPVVQPRSTEKPDQDVGILPEPARKESKTHVVDTEKIEFLISLMDKDNLVLPKWLILLAAIYMLVSGFVSILILIMLFTA